MGLGLFFSFCFIFLLKLFSLFIVIAFIMKNITCDLKRNDLATWWQYAVKNIVYMASF